MTFVYILIAILVFGSLILIHEFGHYIFARIFKVKIYEFSIGMGPKLLSHTSKKTNIKYSLSAFPIGGYVSMAGEEDGDESDGSITKKPKWQRMIIMAAGAIMNLLLGMILMFIVVRNSAIGTTVIGQFISTDKSGYTVTTEGTLQLNDEIIRVDGARVHTSAELDYEILHSGGGDVCFTVIRDGEEIDVTANVPTVVEEGANFGMRDFLVYAEGDRTLLTDLKHTWYRSVSTMKMIWESLIDLVKGKYGIRAVSGPVGVTEAISEAAASSHGALNVLFLAAVITMNLGIFNLLPFPALDGGRLLFLLIELIIRRPIPKKIDGYVNGIGFALLMLFALIITMKDILFAIIG